MAIKVAQGSTITETKTTTVLPADGARTLSDGLKLPSEAEFFDWISNMTPESLAKYDTEMRLHRIANGRKTETCEELWYPPDSVKFSQRWVQGKFGGGTYRVWVKMEKQVRFTVDFELAGVPKKPEEIGDVRAAIGTNGSAGGYAAMGSETSMVLRELVGMLRDELRAARGGGASETAVNNAVALSGQVFSSAVGAATETLRQVNGAGSAAPNPMDDLTKQFMAAAIGKLLNPSDPIETFGKMMLAMKAINDQSGGGGAQQETLVQTVVRVLPQVLDKVQSGMANMATLRQQELEIMRLRGGAPPNAITVRPQQAAAQPNPLPAAAADGAATSPQPPPTPAPQAAGPPPGMGMQDFIELGIARIANNPNLTAEGAAMEMLVLLDAYVPELVDGTCNDPEAESNLLKMFRERPILQQVPQNPRLTELIQNFLEKARESRSQMQPPEGAQPGGIPPAADAGGEPAQPSA